MYEDVWSKSKLDVSDVLDVTEFNYYITNQRTYSESDFLGVRDMLEKNMMIETRPRYPSDKLSFTIADVTKEKSIRYLNIYLNLNGQFDVNVILESSQRNFLSSPL